MGRGSRQSRLPDASLGIANFLLNNLATCRCGNSTGCIADVDAIEIRPECFLAK